MTPEQAQGLAILGTIGFAVLLFIAAIVPIRTKPEWDAQ